MSLDLEKEFPHTKFYNLADAYSDFIPFTVNSNYPVHRWYRFKEGYSRDIVHLLLGSFGRNAQACLDPFGGSGTTALACQEIGLKCYSFEVNPFMYSVAQAKLETGYTVKEFDKSLAQLKANIKKFGKRTFPIPIMSTITKRPGTKKWLFAPISLQAILVLRFCIKKSPARYAQLFSTVLASILPDVGNTIKDGKCVRYKRNWRKLRITREAVYKKFYKQCQSVREDISHIEEQNQSSNKNHFKLGSSLEKLAKLKPKSIDIVITSPPYLNSFDYTDVYMPELWSLGFVEKYEDVRSLRTQTLRSHVQVKWQNETKSLNGKIKPLIDQIVGSNEKIWNSTIPNMISGYFSDMTKILEELKRIVKPRGKVCIVVGTSSYYKVTIPTDIILAEIAISLGFHFNELRILRELKRSTQQTDHRGKALPRLRESLLLFTAPKTNGK